MAYAQGKKAKGECDRCGQIYRLDRLRSEKNTGVSQHNKVCPQCWDDDHPQRFLHRVRADDRMALRDPRPKQDLADSRKLSAWNPVGYHDGTSEIKVSVGQVKVETS